MSETGRDILTGRFEAYVLTSNILSMAGVYADGSPTIGTVPDHMEDDPHDVIDAYDCVRIGHGIGLARDGLRERERQEINYDIAREAGRKARYSQLVAGGMDSEEARIRVIRRPRN